MQALEDLWKSLPLPSQLPLWLRDSTGLYLTIGLLLAGVLYGVYRMWRGGDPQEREMRREIRAARRNGDFLSVGQRYESLGRMNAALAAYRRGGLHAEAADLLQRMGQRQRAKQAAREGEVWVLYADLCREDEEFDEAAAAYEKAGKLYDAARSWEEAGQDLRAAHFYVAAGLEYNAAKLLMQKEGRGTAEALEAAVRSSLREARGSAMSPDMVAAVRHGVQLWVSEDEPERAFNMARDSEQWELAAPIARDYLEPDPARAEVCERADAFLAAAEIYKKLGNSHQEALCRAEHSERRDDHAEAARWYETAEAWSRAADQWAAAENPSRAAELYAQAEEFEQAAVIYDAMGDAERARAMRHTAHAHDPRTMIEAAQAAEAGDDASPPPSPQGDDTRQMRPQAAHDDDPTRVGPAAPPGMPAMPVPPTHERYTLRDELGRGGMGVVYRAYDSILEREVAYKVLSTEITLALGDPQALLKEARAAARLEHTNIVRIYDAGEIPNGFFVVMELVIGENFAELLKERQFSIPGAVLVARQICAALDHAHRRHIIHRDLKPSNLMWTPESQLKLTDFGLARAFEDSMGKVLTRPAGTPYYMSPEQIRGDPVDLRTDIYSFGCVLFELLCRRAPFAGGGSSIYHHLNTRPEDPRATRQGIPEDLARVILQCLEKNPDDRPSSAATVGQQLAALQGLPPTA